MKEMLGNDNEYGIVTENNEEALFQGMKRLLNDKDLLVYYRRQAQIRGNTFRTEETVRSVEKKLLGLLD